MSASKEPRKRLPQNPSEENLRKQAKHLAKEEGVQLAAAQHRLAIEYGYRNWAELMRAVAPRFVPLVPLRELVAFPLEMYPVYVGRPKSISAIDAVAAGSPILLIAQRDATLGEPSVRPTCTRSARSESSSNGRRCPTVRRKSWSKAKACESQTLSVRERVLQGRGRRGRRHRAPQLHDFGTRRYPSRLRAPRARGRPDSFGPFSLK